MGRGLPSLRIAVLKAFLTAKGHRVRTVDLNLRLYLAAGEELRRQWQPDRHQFWMDPGSVRRAFEGELRAQTQAAVEDILDSDPRVVGFSALYSNEAASLILSRMIKERRPDILVVFGGPQASKDAGAAKILETGTVDYAFEGEGELSFSEFLERLASGGEPAAGAGLLFRRGGRIVDTGLHPHAAALSAQPPPGYSDFPMLSYTDAGCIPVSLSRGCPNKCAFCYEVQYWKRFRVRKAASLIAEVRRLRTSVPQVSWLWFHDSLINGHMGELRKFASGLIDAGLQTRWASQAVIRPEMSREVLQLLKASGCISLNYGLESASFATMLKMGKVLAKGSDLDRIVRDTFEAGIDCILNFMFGFPGETEEDFQITLDFVERNKRWITLAQPSPGFCDFYVGTEGQKNPDKFGIALGRWSSHWTSKDGTNTYLTRMARFERFLEVVHGLGIPCTYTNRTLYMKDTIIGNYLFEDGRYREAIPYLERALKNDPPSDVVTSRLTDSRWYAAGAALARVKAA
ncbi:MAG: radical SAM protein [Elusimicrobiota bacterium]